MSLDMTMGARAPALAAEAEAVTAVTPAERLWLKDLLAIAVATVGVAISSALGVLLFLR